MFDLTFVANAAACQASIRALLRGKAQLLPVRFPQLISCFFSIDVSSALSPSESSVPLLRRARARDLTTYAPAHRYPSLRLHICLTELDNSQAVFDKRFV